MEGRFSAETAWNWRSIVKGKMFMEAKINGKQNCREVARVGELMEIMEAEGHVDLSIGMLSYLAEPSSSTATLSRVVEVSARRVCE